MDVDIDLKNANKCHICNKDFIQDGGYETSPAPSIPSNASFDLDDSIADPMYVPSVSPSNNSESDRSNEYDINFGERLISSSPLPSLFTEKCEPKIKILSNITLTSNNNSESITQSKNEEPHNDEAIENSLQYLLKKKKTYCKFCQNEVTNFERHLERNHTDEKEVQDMLSYSKKHPERKKIIGLIRNYGNFKEYLKGNLRPKYSSKLPKNTEYYPCSQCRVLLTKNYLPRHQKRCVVQKINDNKFNPKSASQTLVACALDQNNTLHKLRVKEEVFSKMRADHISLTAKTDILICHFGENYLKKHKREQLHLACSNKIRELARFIIEFRKLTNNPKYCLQDIFIPRLFDTAIECAKKIGGYDATTKSYRSPSLSAHIGTSLKQSCDLLIRLILKEDESVVFKINNKEETLKNVKRFRELIETQWTTEISSLAFKDLNEKKWNKPIILPLTQDILKFKNYVTEIANKAVTNLTLDKNNKKEFKNLVEASLTLTILFNRRRIGDVQYTLLKTYTENVSTVTSVNLKEFENALTESEKNLTKHYKRLVTGGKGSRAIAILLPITLQTYIDLFIKIRSETNLVPDKNPYLFACPGTVKWTRGDVIIRRFAMNAGLKYPLQMSSNRFRKQIATVMQILNLNKEESEQFSTFMGHTEKTHNEFYKLPQDVYQTAKISKLLLLMEKSGNTSIQQFKGKSLADIDINPDEEFAEEDAEEDAEDYDDNDIFPFKEPVTRDEEINEALTPNPSKIKTRIPWTLEQIKIVKCHFKEHIVNKQAPKKKECLELINKYHNVLHNKDWVQVKTYVYNVYKKK
ncbi:unnamed protein product [Brassicogethes aeneus]|uniref:Uncharacterized protein n=1 Tax=Brassicogethes aeneus TaxID=1431903 RepID=A0A9P0BBB0_BRAAE|nr:unnamed protein product [Brassicogethes aeneus]